ncbi:hypothetical protein ACU52_02345 [Xylanibacter rarus]|uniref:PD-(D/E)XK nuclease superfamily protein n=1 Tax=Xylanibacter rarus TaxID=1676614 RepID=A0A8E1QZF1_9BACT|nr:hypothetical protein ACU52_02345 [Xylanibacter rarus]
MVDLLGDALHTENLRETAHCRILYGLLQNKDIQKDFIEYFLPDIDCSFESIEIPYPDKRRIDLTIKGDTFFLIIENKINGACEQNKQIDRYVQTALNYYSANEIYVLYLCGESNKYPSEYSISSDTKDLLCDRIICKNYKDNITPWVASVYEHVDFDEQPFLKSALLMYRTYLENKYKINSQYKEMNNKLDQTIIETLGLESMSLKEKINVVEDQINNIDKISERLSSLLQEYKSQNNEKNIRQWYDECVKILSGHPVLTMADNIEFGFDFKYRNTRFRCCVSYDNNKKPFWGISGLTENIYSRPNVFNDLQNFVLQSNKGFHNNEYNSKEWAVSDYEDESEIVNKFITLTRLICSSEQCTLIE